MIQPTNCFALILSGRMDAGAVVAIIMVSTFTVVSCHQVCFIGSVYDPHSGIPGWFLPYKDPCNCTAIRLGGMSTHASSYRQGAPYYLDELILSEDPKEIKAFLNCKVECFNPMPLGLEDGTIRDDRIRASSTYPSYPASNGRLNNDGTWGASDNSWIEVDLVESTVVTGVIIQGGGTVWFVTKFKVSYQAEPPYDYKHVTDANGNTEEFNGNTDTGTPVTNKFYQSIVATVVRIEPTAWNGGVALRFELLGCRLN